MESRSDSEPLKPWAAGVLLLAAALPAGGQTLPRDFAVPLPLFSAECAWNQRAAEAVVPPESDEQILVLYRVLLGDRSSLHPPGAGVETPFPYAYVNHDEFSVPVFRASSEQQTVLMRDYAGNLRGTNPRLPPGPDGSVIVPAPAGTVRPAGPEGTDADGHMVLYDPETYMEYDFWQATTVPGEGGGRPGTAILEAGAIELFDARGPGANPPTYSSARATGTPLLAGMILPEDIERGRIDHALAFAIPGPRNTNVGNPGEPRPSDYFYPASTTEVDFFNSNARALAAGQRLRLKQSLVDREGSPIDENQLVPITRVFLTALRTYGAYLVDNSGSFAFYAEDIHTAVLHLGESEFNALAGRPSGAPLPPGKTRWQVLIERLNEELERIPVAVGWQEGQDPATAAMTTSNWEVVEPARRP